jgi:hypothetical protein
MSAERPVNRSQRSRRKSPIPLVIIAIRNLHDPDRLHRLRLGLLYLFPTQPGLKRRPLLTGHELPHGLNHPAHLGVHGHREAWQRQGAPAGGCLRLIYPHQPDWLLYEGPLNFQVDKQQLAYQMSVNLIAWRYAALVVRYPSSVCLVGPFNPPTTPGS